MEIGELRRAMALATLLRGFAQDHEADPCRDLFLELALLLESRAHILAETGTPPPESQGEPGLHAHVNLVI